MKFIISKIVFLALAALSSVSGDSLRAGHDNVDSLFQAFEALQDRVNHLEKENHDLHRALKKNKVAKNTPNDNASPTAAIASSQAAGGLPAALARITALEGQVADLETFAGAFNACVPVQTASGVEFPCTVELSDLKVDAGATVGGDLTVGGATSLGGSLDVAGDASINGALTANGGATITATATTPVLINGVVY